MAQIPMTQIRIMIVENQGIVALDIQGKLERMGYEVPVVVSSGEEAIQKAEEIHPDLILMDIQLQGDMDGVVAAKQIRDRLSIPVIYLTALSEYSTVQRVKMTQPLGYIVKPFEEEELRTTIEQALFKHKEEGGRSQGPRE